MIYIKKKDEAARNNQFFCWEGVNVFELMHPVCGHEYMLMGMALDPDWVKDMVNTYADLTISLMEILFTEVGKPDGIWFYEDMGFKQRPFMSPAMYKEIIQPGHKKTFGFAHSRSLPVIVHSCGYVEPLVPGLIEAGMDVRNLVANDLDAIEKELNQKIPVVKEGSGYILHSDHSIPAQCQYQTYRFFINEGLKLGGY